MTKALRDSLSGNYHVVIDSALTEGSLTYGEAYFKGESEKEILISTYLCHPSMANNECSGPAVATVLADYVKNMKHRKYSYRFLFIPETIGSITYLSQNYERLHLKENVIAGFVLSCVGDERTYSMVESRKANTLVDKVLKNVLHYIYPEYKKYSYLERGSDERQYNAPGIDLPVCAVCRSKYGEYPEYHTSKDDLSLVTPEGLMGSYELMTQVFEALEHNAFYRITCKCEPQLGRRGLYPTVSKKNSYDGVQSMTDFLAYADGEVDLIDISNIIGVSVHDLVPMAEKLLENGLIISDENR
jgi:aminopeptidase-like protein